ncbi:thioredoxin domain-containing protein [Cryobacterium psychrophilum]|uniref:Thioredoxin domain-containing protein n=1 Tax=Cryobacterium psychrophilum TaxID=41988 RepID=A0A4Y8KT37_9MICO|nr:thioredoxin domain-containing protein [Cryobacterium psychrophilum]TDW29367.1 hypothetical protein EDD25_1061 [Cryobacterium psychrophilum]TFD81484.1 thioredoxin domain-containing protein [Cryobacterium psychrophilum]
MPNRLVDAISPYLRSHAENPVDWHGWGAEAFTEARNRDLPVLVSIGYSTCHWCHVMARESFSDPDLAGYLNDNFVSIKVDREEHPDVDASYLAAASAFVQGLGWPLNVFVTPDGKAFHAGTYFPPRPMLGNPSFREVLEAVTDAWTTRRREVEAGASRVAEALAESSVQLRAQSDLPDAGALEVMVSEISAMEDVQFGGFGTAPKFPVAPALGFLLDRVDGQQLALRTLKRLGASPLRDPIEGGFFRYAVNRDWSEPHYERMLYDNAQLLDHYTQAWKLTGEPWARLVAEGVGRFLVQVMQLPGGGFASAQDSESTVKGQRVEGGYYTLDVDARRAETPPALDDKVLTGWNGLAIGALARAGFAFGESGAEMLGAARRAADYLQHRHVRADGTLVRASIGSRTSVAEATLEDYGMYSRGLLELALSTGDVSYAVTARSLLDSTLRRPSDKVVDTEDSEVFRAPNGADPVLEAQGLAIALDPSEGAYPSGLTATAGAANILYLLTAEPRYRAGAEAAMSHVAALVPDRPLAFGATLRLFNTLTEATEQLVVVSPTESTPKTPTELVEAARRHPAALVASVTEQQAQAFANAGFELFAGRTAMGSRPRAYLCLDFVCLLPVTDAAALGGPGAS